MYSINSTVLYKYNIIITLVEYSFDSKYYFDEYFQSKGTLLNCIIMTIFHDMNYYIIHCTGGSKHKINEICYIIYHICIPNSDIQ